MRCTYVQFIRCTRYSTYAALFRRQWPDTPRDLIGEQEVAHFRPLSSIRCTSAWVRVPPHPQHHVATLNQSAFCAVVAYTTHVSSSIRVKSCPFINTAPPLPPLHIYIPLCFVIIT